MKPHDALQLELEGISTGATDELRDVLALADGLRAAAAQIGTPPGLQARRGAILATAAPAATQLAGRGSRIARAVALAGMLAAGVAIGWVGAVTSDVWLRGGGPPPAAAPDSSDEPDKRPLPSTTPRPTPSPTLRPPDTPEETQPESVEPSPAETMELETDEPEATPDDSDNSGPGSDNSGSGSDGSGSGGDSYGSGSGGDSD